MTDDEAANYDEFGMLKLYADYESIPWYGQPQVARQAYYTASGQKISALVWGDTEPTAVFLHGGGQNAHTWDSVALALDLPLIALDLPGHGHSDWREDRDYWPKRNATVVAEILDQAAPRAEIVVGMSLGGLTNIRLASLRPDLVRRAVIVDVTPGVGARSASMTPEQRGASSLVSGPRTFGSFEEMLTAAAAAVPGRPFESLRAGVLHNAKRRHDGTWGWRYDKLRDEDEPPNDFTELWDDYAQIRAPLMLVRGARSHHIHDEDEAQMRALQADVRIEVVEGAGHSVQSDRPVELARLIRDFQQSTLWS